MSSPAIESITPLKVGTRVQVNDLGPPDELALKGAIVLVLSDEDADDFLVQIDGTAGCLTYQETMLDRVLDEYREGDSFPNVAYVRRFLGGEVVT